MTSKLLCQRTRGTERGKQPLPPVLALASFSPPTVAASSSPAVPPIQNHYKPLLLFPEGGFAANAAAAAAAALLLCFLLSTSLKGGNVHTLSLHFPSTNGRASVFRAGVFEMCDLNSKNLNAAQDFPPEPRAHLSWRERSAQRDPSAMHPAYLHVAENKLVATFGFGNYLRG